MKDKKPTISDLKELLPLSDTYMVTKGAKYLIIVKPSRIIGGSSITPQKLQELKEWIIKHNLQAFLIVAEEGDIKIMELRND